MDKQRRFPQASEPDGGATEFGTHQTEQTNDQLLNQLAELWASMDETNFDPEAIDACLDALDARDPVCVGFDAEASLAAFRAAHAELFEASSPSVSSKPRKRRLVRTGVVVAAAVVASLVLVQAGGFAENIIYPKDTGEQFHFGIDVPGGGEGSMEIPPDVESKSYPTLQAALDDCGITTPLVPTWYPEGFILSEVDVTCYSNAVKFYAQYENGNESVGVSIFQYKTNQYLKTGKFREFEKDIANAEPYSRDSVEHYIMENNGYIKASWTNDMAIGSVFGDITKEEITKMLDSIY